MMHRLAVAASAALCCCDVTAYQWSTTGGSSSRSGLFPPTAFDSIVGFSSSVEETASSVRSAASKQLDAVPVTPYASVQYTLGQGYKLDKPAAPLVTSSGVVVVVGPDCDIVGLPSPDKPYEGWSREAFLVRGEDNPAVGPQCIDGLLDEQDNLYHVTGERNLIDFDADNVTAYAVGTSSLTLLPGYPVNTGNAMPTVDLYALGGLYTSGKFYMPATPILDGKGMVVVDTASGNTNPVAMGKDNEDHMAGSIAIPNPSLGDGTLAVVMNSGSANYLYVSPNGIMAAYRSDGSQAWTSSGAQGPVGGLQPPPLYIPSVPVGRLYSVLSQAIPPQLACVYTNGNACSGFPVNLTANVQGYATGWWYAGALVPSAADATRVSRMLYTVDLQATSDPALPIGCMVALSPKDGSLQDSYCVPRDPAGRVATANFLATAPVVYLNARGTGLHTAFVSQFDSIVLAFDPANLAAGPLYALDPIKAGDAITAATDYMSVTAGGTLLMTGWRAGNPDNQYVITAIVNPTMSVTPAGSNGPAPLAPGAVAAIAVVVIAAVVGAAVFPIYRRGGMDAVKSSISGLIPGKGRYMAVPTASAGDSLSGFGSKGGYGSVSSASSESTGKGGAVFSNL